MLPRFLFRTVIAGVLCTAAPLFAADFTIAVSPISQTGVAGTSFAYTVTISKVGGFSGVVTFSMSGLPTGATATFSPTTVTGSGTSTLTVATTGSTPLANNTLTVTGT